MEQDGRWRISQHETIIWGNRLDYVRTEFRSFQPVVEQQESGYSTKEEARTRLRAWAEANLTRKKEYSKTRKEAKIRRMTGVTETTSADAAAEDQSASAAAQVKNWLPQKPHAEPSDYLADLRLRGGEFGLWVGDKERQAVLDAGYGAFRDLAEAAGLATDGVSLKGTLGVAFGARGSGPFAGHYEPGRVVINLTKTSGAGVLCHEFAHGLDHWAGRRALELGLIENLAMDRPFLSDSVFDMQYIPSVRMEAVVKGMEKAGKPVPPDARPLMDLANAMWGLKWENVAPKTREDYEAMLNAKFEKRIAEVEDYMNKNGKSICAGFILSEMKESDRKYERKVGGSTTGVPLTAEEMRAKDAKMNERAINYSEEVSRAYVDIMRERMSAPYGTVNVIGAMQSLAEKLTLVRQTKGLTPYLKKTSDYFIYYHGRDVSALDRLRLSPVLPPIWEQTQYSKEVSVLTEYYKRPHEQFARAFESFVVKELEAKGRQSPYLVTRAGAFDMGHPKDKSADLARFIDGMKNALPKLDLSAPLVLSEESVADDLPVEVSVGKASVMGA
jgi:hypothetical protein